ncbi:uncharacterized protein LOC132271169 [Cornus florida]|uniref:uncharacterized protein LOC132271169 n=1 Tax=Cornus florida TaxID=4283 RepID=UPI00289C720A|nr:uncharacterized protein LOC132271169 [Cornus florida]
MISEDKKVLGWDYQEGSKMGIKAMMLFFIFFLHFSSLASFFALGNTLPSGPVRLQENMEGKGMDEHGSSTNGGGNGIAHHSKFARGAGGRAAGTAGEEANGGTSTQGGTAVIPIYAAGAASGHRTHHGAASSSRSCLGLPTLGAAILASVIVHT